MSTKSTTHKNHFEYGYALGKETFEEDYSKQDLTEDDVREFVTSNLAPPTEQSNFILKLAGVEIPPQDYDIGFVIGWLSSLLAARLSQGKPVPYLLPLLDAVQHENEAVLI